MKKQHHPLDDSLAANIKSLLTFWNRRSFHDMGIDSIVRIDGRVLINLDEYALVLLNATRYKEDIEEFPTAWISEQIRLEGTAGILEINSEMGNATIQFRNLRLIDRKSMTILIPALDSN